MKAEGRIFIVMGVSGCGKSTLGRALAGRLELPFFDGDDFHPRENIQKMAAGMPLDDRDRQQWLRRLNEVARQNRAAGAVIACSALKERYRKLLQEGLEEEVIWVYLHGSFREIHSRLGDRKGHYMPASLLRSQFETLEPPPYGIHIPVRLSTNEAVSTVLKALDPH